MTVRPWLLLAALLPGCAGDWRTASRESAGIAPNPAVTREAVIQVYAAPTYGWRGLVAVHTWISVKPVDASSYTVYEVVGWRQYRGLPVLRVAQDLPDRYWFGERPDLLLDVRGDKAARLITEIERKVDEYPWKETYKAWPGPNSNTFPAWIAQEIPELGLKLPLKAIGKNWID